MIKTRIVSGLSKFYPRLFVKKNITAFQIQNIIKIYFQIPGVNIEISETKNTHQPHSILHLFKNFITVILLDSFLIDFSLSVIDIAVHRWLRRAFEGLLRYNHTLTFSTIFFCKIGQPCLICQLSTLDCVNQSYHLKVKVSRQP